MVRARIAGLLVVTVVCALLPGAASAQQASGIAGVVRDTSGGVLPGVTVEASSPALIEKVRSVVADSEGRYNVVDLRPGTYVVTFSLTGFTTFRREGIILSAGFTATVNADMQVGSLEETITVTGEAPLIDTQNVRKQTVVSRELLDILPTSNKGQNTLVTLTPGLTGIAEVGGQYTTQVGNTFHGKAGTKVQFDGMGVQNLSGVGNTGYIPNAALVEEMVLQTSGISAESSADGIIINMIPREGANTFSGSVLGLYTNDHFQSDNLTAALRDRGLTTVNKTLKVYDATITLGGPIKKDKLWFFTSHREWGNGNQNAGLFWNKTQGTPFYTFDLSRPADRFQWYESHAVRVTWQASQKNKFNFFADMQDVCVCRSASGVGDAPEAVQAYHFRPGGLYQASWNAPATNKLLFEAVASYTQNDWPNYLQPGVSRDDVSILEQSTNIRYNAKATYLGPNVNDRYGQRFAVSYVTGSHAFKAGLGTEEGRRKVGTFVNHDVNYRFNNVVPNQITQYATPYVQRDEFKADLGLFAQDQWAIRRLTLNLGLRFDYFNGSVPPQHVPATSSGWVPARDYPAVKGVPAWKDLSPRLGAAYDLFGHGRTALKFSLGRYVRKTGVDIANANNPINTSVNSVTRTWTDANGNFIPDCDLSNFAANGECLAISDQSFGKFSPTTRWADDVLHGFGVREFNWDLSTELQHQLRDGVSLTAGYYRNWYGNLRVTDNLEVTSADYSPYCVTAPKDSRLPGGGGYQVCGLYDLAPAKFGQVSNLVAQSSNYGKRRQINDFFNVSLDTRFGSGVRIGGGFDTGRTVNDQCFAVDAPGLFGYTTASTAPPQVATTIDGERICRVVTPFKAQTQLKFNGSYPLPGDFVVSGVFQNVSGPPIDANYAATNTEIARSLGRNLAACGTRTPCTATATAPLVKPQTLFEGRLTQFNFRLTKIVRVSARMRLQANLDVYNAFNSSAVLLLNSAYGSRWQLPTQILDGRLFQFSAQLTY